MRTLILYNGPIYTLVPGQPVARAIAIRDGRVLAVGSEGKVQAAAGSRAETINLQGRAVVPGLTDAHVHITLHGFAMQQIRLDGVTDYQVALARIAERVKSLPQGSYLRGGGWNHADWGGKWPTRDDLDKICPDRPALLSRKDGHSLWVNSKALELAGITDDTPDPFGGQIQRDSKGRATGILFETAIDLVRAAIAPPTPEERRAALRAAINEGLGYGLTAIQIPPSTNHADGRETLEDLQVLRERGQLQIRCQAHLAGADLDRAVELGVRSGLGDRWLRIGGLKLFADGSLGSETAEMLAPYEGRRGTGLATLSEEELYAAVHKANQNGISVIVHAIGDAANRKVLDAIEVARSDSAPLAVPNRIEHCQVIHANDLPRFAALGVIASMQPIHATSDMLVADELWGKRCALAYAWRSFLESGATLAFGSDAPVETLNPWPGVHAAVTRQRADNTPEGGWYPEQRLSVEESLRAYCHGPAVAAAEANERGTLAPGMLADLAVLDRDPFRTPPAELHKISATMTIVEGNVVMERKSTE
jgi:predicted amidohydrolase YtcJ